MISSAYALKVTMYNTCPVYNWLQLVHQRQNCVFKILGKSLSTITTCRSRCYQSCKGSKSLDRMTTHFCDIGRVLVPKTFGQDVCLHQSHVPIIKFHTNRTALKSQQSQSHRHCWNCGRDTNPVKELFFCDCGVVQKPAIEITYFDIMQLKPSFDIDIKRLSDVFKETQKKLHPDKFSTKTQEERDLAHQQSALLNKAYNTLQKPLNRALYLLKLQNIEISEGDNFTENEFLMEIMEINEQISGAKKSSDVEILQETNNAKIAKCVKDISDLYNKNLINDMKSATIKLRYYTTIQERINEIKRSRMG